MPRGDIPRGAEFIFRGQSIKTIARVRERTNLPQVMFVLPQALTHATPLCMWQCLWHLCQCRWQCRCQCLWQHLCQCRWQCLCQSVAYLEFWLWVRSSIKLKVETLSFLLHIDPNSKRLSTHKEGKKKTRVAHSKEEETKSVSGPDRPLRKLLGHKVRK